MLRVRDVVLDRVDEILRDPKMVKVLVGDDVGWVALSVTDGL